MNVAWYKVSTLDEKSFYISKGLIRFGFRVETNSTLTMGLSGNYSVIFSNQKVPNKMLIIHLLPLLQTVPNN